MKLKQKESQNDDQKIPFSLVPSKHLYLTIFSLRSSGCSRAEHPRFTRKNVAQHTQMIDMAEKGPSANS